MRLAILADIHGNLPALDAVMQDLQTQTPDAVYVAGDVINRCPWNNEVMDIVTQQGWSIIRGNHELVIASLNTPSCRPPFTERSLFPTLYWTHEQLTSRHLDTIRQWEGDTLVIWPNMPWIHLFHGQPLNPFLGLYPEMSDAEVEAILADAEESIIVCAHTHRPMLRQTGDYRIYNGGSIGAPYNSDPRAQYLLLDAVEQGSKMQWQPTLRQVEYDRSVLPSAFAASGMLRAIGPSAEMHLRTAMTGEPWSSDFGHWLRTKSATAQVDMTQAAATYLSQHGPGRWAFQA